MTQSFSGLIVSVTKMLALVPEILSLHIVSGDFEVGGNGKELTILKCKVLTGASVYAESGREATCCPVSYPTSVYFIYDKRHFLP